MKIALYIEDGLEQIVLTPESETEKGILGKIHDGSRQFELKKGSFYECRGGWTRYEPFWETNYYGRTTHGDESTMIVLRPASVDRSAERQDREDGLDPQDESAVAPQQAAADAQNQEPSS